jgi:hypothetical protein
MSNQGLPPPDLSRLRGLVENLDRLAKKMPDLTSDEEIKDQATRLRLLLVYNEYGAGWTSVGLPGKPKILAPDVMASVGPNLTEILLAFSSGATVGGGQATAPIWSNRIPTPEERAARQAKGPPVPIALSLGRFVEGKSVIVKGTTIVRRQVINYVTNKLSVAHYDAARDPDELLLDQVNDGRDTVLGLRPVFNELLSYAQQLLNSADTQRFLAEARKLIS